MNASPSRARDAKAKVGLLVLVAASALGLVLYVWPALSAPVVVWSDSRVDLERVERGFRAWDSPAPELAADAAAHPVKPGYLLFLTAATAAVPGAGAARSAVVVQSVVLALSIAAAAFAVGARRGWRWGLVLCVVLFSLLRLRDSASAVMSEAISAAGALALTAVLVSVSVSASIAAWRKRDAALWGAGAAALFWIRPNVGALVLGTGIVLVIRRPRLAGSVLAGFVALAAPVWLVSQAGGGGVGDPWRGLATPLLGASRDYYWSPAPSEAPLASPREVSREKLREAAANWRQTLSDHGPDASRQKLWRALHGLFGAELYDPRWSGLYRRLDLAARTLTPFVTLAALALLASLPFRRAESSWNAAALFLVAGILVQDLVLGSHPRYVLPLLPSVLMLAVTGAPSLREASPWRRSVVALVFAAGIVLLASRRGLLDWEWGRVEAAGVHLRQSIPRGALPDAPPVTLHVRIGPPLLPSDSHLEIFGPGERLLYSSSLDAARERPDVAFLLPAWLLEANRRGPVELDLVSRGVYDDRHYLIFPVVPQPWGRPSRREESPELSPSTGIASGSLDWWAHRGLDAAPTAPFESKAAPSEGK